MKRQLDLALIKNMKEQQRPRTVTRTQFATLHSSAIDAATEGEAVFMHESMLAVAEASDLDEPITREKYTDWISLIFMAAVQYYEQAKKMGIELEEPWCVRDEEIWKSSPEDPMSGLMIDDVEFWFDEAPAGEVGGEHEDVKAVMFDAAKVDFTGRVIDPEMAIAYLTDEPWDEGQYDIKIEADDEYDQVLERLEGKIEAFPHYEWRRTFGDG